jgi:outer membrane autotransporter protein
MQARKTPKLSKTSRAVRAALAVSASMLALAGSGVATAGDFYLYNDIDLVSSELGDAYGVEATVTGTYDTATVVNVGSIEATSAHGNAFGIQLAADGFYGAVYVDNEGEIAAHADEGVAIGMLAQAYGAYGEVSIVNSGDVQVDSSTVALGVLAYSSGKYAVVESSGDIDVVASNDNGDYAYATGVGVAAFYGVAALTNSGDISVLAEGGSASANGAWVSIYGGNASLVNYGDIVAEAVGEYGAQATGATASSAFLSAAVYNTGLVEASAEGGVYATATGIRAQASEFGLIALGDDAEVVASASAVYDARATGAYSSGLFANLYNDGGTITVEASADADDGDARAYGAITDGAFSSVYLLGDSEISASAEGAYALAVGSLQYGYFTGFVNEGSIEASATGDTGFAIGVAVIGLSGTHLYNYGDISAVASGDYVEAVGLFASSYYYDADLTNAGTISATSDDRAVAVQLTTTNSTHIYNSGTIQAEGGVESIAIYSAGSSSDYVYNEGTITGSIWLGEGDDTIENEGTINLVDASIDLGTFAVDGNHFYNTGTVAVDGDSVIDMGGPIALVPSLNPYAFYNDGFIDLQDGEANDSLTIIGDLAGEGEINVDVSGADGSADQVHIDGSVVAGTTQTLNVALLDAPDQASSSVAVVTVSGDSAAGDFELGDVDVDAGDSLLAFDFSLVADVDASNATDDVFSLGIEVTGLGDPGALAASIGPAAQSLMNAQVGTWRQRAGLIEGFGKGGMRLWARAFQDKGAFSPDHTASDFGQGGNFDWSQKNSGIEAGVDFSVGEEVSLGLLMARSQADTHLDKPGVGSADLDADTWGVYGTWISPRGFYQDASYRWMSFDVDLESIAGAMRSSGDAEAFNVEAGYAWTLAGGLKIEPQLQYTRTNVDKLALVTSSGMSFVADGGDSSRGRLGVALRKNFGEADTGWLLTPSATLSAVREFDGKHAYAINGDFHGATSVEGTSALVELGLSARHENWTVSGGLNWQDGGAVDSFFGGQLSVRYDFGGAAR